MNIENESYTNEQKSMIKTLCELISIPSVKGENYSSAPFGRYTLESLEYVLNTAEKMGFKAVNLDGYAGFVEFGEGEKEIAALCHLDVVPAGEGWDFDPFTPVVENGKIYGRGTNDDKGPAVAVLYAMKELKDLGFVPPCRIRLILGLDEESGSQCMVHYKKSQALPDYGFTPDAKFPVIFAEKGILHITIEANRNEIKFSDSINTLSNFRSSISNINSPSSSISSSTSLSSPSSSSSLSLANDFFLISAKGGERANMVPATCKLVWQDFNKSQKNDDKDSILSRLIKDEIISGKPGHASMPEFGENAISKAMEYIEIILKTNNLKDAFVDFYNSSIGMTTDGSKFGIDYTDEESGALTLNAGLLDLNTETVSLTIDIRYPVTASESDIIDKINTKCALYNLKISDASGNIPLHVDKNSLFVQTLLKVYEKITNTKSQPIAIGGGTYARSMKNVVAFGPNFLKEDDVAHQSGEYMKIDDFFLCQKIYKEAIVELTKLL